MRRLARFIALAVLFGFLPQTTHAQALVTKPLGDLSTPTLVQENRAILLERGCVEVVGDTAAQTVAHPTDKPVQLYPNDWTVGKYVFCPESVQSTVTIKEGKVAGLWWILCVVATAGLCSTVWVASWFISGDSIQVKILKYFLDMVDKIVIFLSYIAVMLIDAISRGAEYLLTVGGFTSNPLIARAWPFVQGLVNIGFVLAFLYIAILTVLRMGEGWSKLLPRLIVAALLLNFSLVFGGILIDTSRFIMAAELRLLRASTSPSDVPFGLQILKKGLTFNAVYPNAVFSRNSAPTLNAPELPAGPALDMASALLEKMTVLAMITVLLLGLLYLMVGLIVRYVALVLLLAVSPVAFLGIAMPNLGSVSKQWWSLFMKYLIFGPIALFFLVMLAFLPRTPIFGVDIAGDLLTVATTAGFLWAAIQVPKRIGGVGAGFVTGAAQRATGFVKRHPALAAGAALGVATGGVGLLAAGAGAAAGYGAYRGGKALGQRGYREARDYVKEKYGKKIGEPLGLGGYSKYDPKTGKARPEYAATGLKARAILATNPDAKAAQNLTNKAHKAKSTKDLITTTEKEEPVIDPKTGKQETKLEQNATTGAIELVPVTRKVKTIALKPELQYDKLAKKNVLDVLNEDELGMLGEAALEVNNKQVLKVMVQNEVVVRNMPTALKAKLMASTEHPDVSDMLNRTMRNISYKDAAK